MTQVDQGPADGRRLNTTLIPTSSPPRPTRIPDKLQSLSKTRDKGDAWIGDTNDKTKVDCREYVIQVVVSRGPPAPQNLVGDPSATMVCRLAGLLRESNHIMHSKEQGTVHLSCCDIRPKYHPRGRYTFTKKVASGRIAFHVGKRFLSLGASLFQSGVT